MFSSSVTVLLSLHANCDIIFKFSN